MKKIFYLLTMVMAVAGGSLTVRAQAVYPTAKTPTNSFAKLVAEDNVGDVYEKVTVNLDKGTVYADGKKTSLRKVLHCSKKKEEQYLEKSVSGFEKSVENQTVCEVEKTSASKVEITNNFQTKRIIAAVTELPQTYGAEKSVKGETAYILKYATEEETQEAYDKLVEEYGEDKIFYDRVYKADEVMDGAVNLETKADAVMDGAANLDTKADAVYTSGSYLDTAKTLGLYNVNQQINKSGYKQNKVTVAVLDSGLVYYTNPSCEIGRKLRDKFNTKMCYVFSNAENARDMVGHGTMVSSVIAYNTPDNVQYGIFKIMDKNNVIVDAAVYAALEQVYALDIDVVNCSFAGTIVGKKESYQLYEPILKKLYEKGVIVCCAAGNVGENQKSADNHYPACSSYTLSVSGLNMNSQTSSFPRASDSSCTGNTVDYSALGVNVYVYTKDAKEAGAEGTSFASPVVASEFAILKTCSDTFMTVPQIREFYDLYLEPKSTSGVDKKAFGRGFFDLSGIDLCTKNHARCCGLWYYDSETGDVGKQHKMVIDLNGGFGYGYVSNSNVATTRVYIRNFVCGQERYFASAYSYQSGDSNGWVGFGNTGSDRGSGTLTDPYRPYREGYIFAGWKCSGYGAINKRIIQQGGKYTEAWSYNGADNENITITAQWVPKNLYNILQVNLNGGRMYKDSQVTTSSFNIYYKPGVYRAICDSSSPGFYDNSLIGEPARTGYSFRYWYKQEGKGMVTRILGRDECAYFTNEFYGYCESVGAFAYMTTDKNELGAKIIAKWEANTYTVNLKVSQTASVKTGTATFDEKYGDLLSYTPVKEGYEFQGWYTSLDGGKQVLPTTKMTIPWDHSLYAHWKKK